MNPSEAPIRLTIDRTQGKCPIGEVTGRRNLENSKIPVLSCEGACIRGEIARLAANMVSREKGYARTCHGELITVPESSIAGWAAQSEKVLLIDGCFLRCHGRILENQLGRKKLIQFDALSYYRKYNGIFDYGDVPEAERTAVARSVADWVIEYLNDPSNCTALPIVASDSTCGECSAAAQ